jgi:hypothetical protein
MEAAFRGVQLASALSVKRCCAGAWFAELVVLETVKHAFTRDAAA